MSKYVFSNTERFVIWKKYDYKCFWCGEPLEHKHTTIDHVFPENLLEMPDELKRIKRTYSLPVEFEINDFCNWVPAHSNCNAKKSRKVFINSPAFLMIVDQVIKKADDVKKSYQNLKKRIKKDKVIMKLLSDLENNSITTKDLYKLVEATNNYPIYNPKPIINTEELTHLPEGWQVISINRDHGKIRITNGSIGADIPIDVDPDRSWMCPTCKNYGPWNGNRCAICGYSSFPE